jgi:fatty-acyl-CoA synthase
MESIKSVQRAYDLVYDTFERVAQTFPGHEVYVDVDGNRYTYRRLIDDSTLFAKGLLELGLRKGDHIALWLPNCYEWLVAQVAGALIGAPVVNLNTRYKEGELSYILRDSDARALILQERLLGIDFVDTLTKVLPDINHTQHGAYLKSESYPALRFCIGVGSNFPSWIKPYRKVMENGMHVNPQRFQECINQVVSTDVMGIFYTSGTTSFPKGVMQTQRSLLRHSFDAFSNWDLQPEDRVLVIPPFSGITGFNMLFGTLTHGAAVITMDVFKPEPCLRLIEQERVSTCVGFDSMYDLLIEAQERLNADLSSLVKGGGAVMERPVQEALQTYERKLGFPMVAPYGLSEANAFLLVGDPNDPLDLRTFAPGGRLLGEDKKVKIVSFDSGLPVQEGEMGEICTKGYHVMMGYYKVPDATKKAIDPDGWLHTGDMGIQKGDYIYYMGRIKDILKVHGFTFSPSEVEEVLNHYPGVEMAQVLGIPVGPGEDHVVACVKLTDQVLSLSAETLIDYCKEKLAGYKAPKNILFVQTFPTTTTGQAGNKIRKHELREWVQKQLNLKSHS